MLKYLLAYKYWVVFILNGITILVGMSIKGRAMTRKRLLREESRRQTRERLLEAAAIVFSRQGFDATSVDQVAEEAGFSKGAVYSNFASKEELFMVLLDRHLETELPSVAAEFEPRESDGKNAGNVQRHSFAQLLEERRTWNILTLAILLYALRNH